MGTSKLQREVGKILRSEFGYRGVIENSRPRWLTTGIGQRLELDFFIPDLGIGVEVQGIQHYQYTPHFHKDYEAFLGQQRRDADKASLCGAFGVQLVHIHQADDAHDLLSRISLHDEFCIARTKSWIKTINRILKENKRLPESSRHLAVRMRFKVVEKIILKIGIDRLLSAVPHPLLQQLFSKCRQFKDEIKIWRKAYRRLPYPHAINTSRSADERSRKKAKHRSCERITDHLFHVSGGRYGTHTVRLSGGNWRCDCYFAGSEPDIHRCCHVVAVLYATGNIITNVTLLRGSR